MASSILALILVLGGVYFLIRNVRLLHNENALREYMQSNPKAAYWVKKYGLDGAMKLTHETFLPFGIAAACGMVGLGVWLLWRLYR